MAGPEMSSFTVLESEEDVAAAAAAGISEALWKGARTLVLAGGTTPRRCYELLSTMGVDWGRGSVLFGGERCVRPSHPGSNSRMSREALHCRRAPATSSPLPAAL